MFKFIHAADLHLDSPLRGLERYEGAPVETIRAATRRALENLVQVALDRRVDFVVIAGDLYDGDWKDHHTGLFFVKQMSRLRAAGIPVVAIAGNHDAANRMTRTLPLPDNVELLPPGLAVTAGHPQLAALGVAVHGRSFAEAAETQNMIPGYPAAEPGKYNIGLLHTSLVGTTGHDPYAPCTVDDLRGKNYHYWALGHVHQRQEVCQDPWVVYSGNTQGRHIRELGAKGCYIVEVSDQFRSTLHFEPLDVIRWETCTLDTSALDTTDDLWPLFRQQLLSLHQRHPGYPLAVRVVLRGSCPFHQTLAADETRWSNEFRAVAMGSIPDELWLEKVQFQTAPVADQRGDLAEEGPIPDLDKYVRELAADPHARAALLQDLADLGRKLPPEVLEELGDLTDPDNPRLPEWLAGAQAVMGHQLGSQGVG
jgi:hypothetical protein